MQRIIFFFIVLSSLFACKSPNLLLYKYKPHYFENSIISKDSVLTLYQEINYNVPNVVDEEHRYELSFHLKDTAAAIAKKKLNLATDTAIVKANYGFSSVWFWGGGNTVVSGSIKILKWNKNKIVLKENVMAYDATRNKTVRYHGTRRFEKKKGW